MSVVKLWQSRGIGVCDVQKLDCEGSEIAIVRALAEAGLLPSVRLVVGEWHVLSDCPEAREQVLSDLQSLLEPTHEVSLRRPLRGREGHFTARTLHPSHR
jgi:hypothetical protein